ncbi:MAG TPA: trypsin-like peptidase domain-containing protein [Kofleriaceae bacterium]|nr:trypsin-like peptidase domain-containing protein [Kofleriaceae bacterium]
MSRPILTAALLAALATAARPSSARAEPAGTRSVLVEIEPDPARSAPSLRADQPFTVFLNTQGGIYTPGEPNDSRENVTSVPDLPADIPAWPGSEEERAALRTCVAELFGPFGVVVTDEDPGDVPHLEAVIGGDPSQLQLMANVAGVSPFLTNCGVIDDSIVFVFPSVVGADPRRLCETVAQEVAHSFGLDHEYLCQDPMTYLTGCGDKSFLFQDSVCGEFEQRECKCGRSQNSAQLLLERVGRGEQPGVWLNQPSSGDQLAAGFPVQAVLTRAPVSLDLYVDGILADSASPSDSGDPYQFVDFDTEDTLRSGTHQVELVARYGGGDRKVKALVEVEGAPGEEVVSEGCAAGGGRDGGALAGLVVLAIALACRRRRGLVAIGLAALAAAPAGCYTSVFGSPTDDIESGCPGAGEVSPAIGVLWTPQGGTCTATLVSAYGLITAAHCVADAVADDEPIVVVLGGRQYIAGAAEVYPEWAPGAPVDDVAALAVTRQVEGVTPLPLDADEPTFGQEFTLIGHGEWAPDEVRDAERQAQVGAVNDVQARSFSYQEEVDDGCLEGRGGGPVLDRDSGQLLGLHGEDRAVMRVDQYACWLACGAAPEALPGGLGECDCTRADSRPCGECGAEFLDFGSRTWSACEPAEDLHPCESGQTCDPSGACVP